MEGASSWARVNVVDRRAVDTVDTDDTDDTVDTEMTQMWLTQSVPERCRQDMGETV